jgi:hypothetical protein
MNSSIAASMIAPRRSAARSARLAAGLTAGFAVSFGETFLGVVARAALLVTRPLAGFDGRGLVVRVFVMIYL